MKKKILIVVLMVIVTIIGMIFLLGSTSLDIETTVIQRKDFIQFYKKDAIVDSDCSYLFYQGSVSSIKKKENDFILKNEVILEYIDLNNKTKQLKAIKDCFIKEINESYVIVSDTDYYLQLELDYDKYCLLKEGSYCSFQLEQNIFEGIIQKKSSLANEDSKFLIRIEPLNKELYLNQKVLVTLPLKKQSGLVVNKKAVLLINQKNYVLSSVFKEHLRNYQDYLLEIEILLENDESYLVEGIGLENLEVCILTTEQKEILGID